MQQDVQCGQDDLQVFRCGYYYGKAMYQLPDDRRGAKDRVRQPKNGRGREAAATAAYVRESLYEGVGGV